MKHTLKVIACLSTLTMGAGIAQAQAAGHTNVQSKYDCTRSLTKSNTGIFRGLGNNVRGGEKRSRKEALIAARDAVSRGYNYALMAPWSRRDYTKIGVSENAGFFGADLKARFKKSEFNLACRALSDEVAYNWMWGEKAAQLEAAPNTALIDLREMITTLDPSDTLRDYRERKSAVDETTFTRPGEREKEAKHRAVKQASAACFTSLSPVSATQFKRSVSAAEKTARQACLQNQAAQARTVGWTGHPALITDRHNTLNNTGYTVNRPSGAGASSSSNSSSAGFLPTDTWGEGWRDLSTGYPNFDGVFITLEEPVGEKTPSSKTTIIASNTLSEDALLDYAVHYTALTRMRVFSNGISIRDRTKSYRSQFDNSMASRQQRIERKGQSEPPLSRRVSSPSYQAAYYLFEQNYQNILVFGPNFIQGNICASDTYIVCADKMQAYNALGPRLNPSGHQPLSAPTGYKPFDPSR